MTTNKMELGLNSTPEAKPAPLMMQGLSLRDYFAGQVINGIAANPNRIGYTHEEKSHIAHKVRVDELNITPHAANALKKAGILTVGHLANLPDRSLMALPSFGKVSLAYVRAAQAKLLAAYGVNK